MGDLALSSEGGRRVGIYNADHAMKHASVGRGAVEEDGGGVVHANGVVRRLCFAYQSIISEYEGRRGRGEGA